MLRLYYNPDCSKSRAVLARMQAAGLQPEIVNYLINPPQRRQLEALVQKLEEPAAQLLRAYTGTQKPDATHVVATLLDAPEQMQRPVVELDTRAFIARPPERVDALLDSSPTPP